MKSLHEPELDEAFVSRKEIFKGKILKISVDTIKLPNGREACRELAKHPGAVAVIAKTDTDELILVKQFRYPINSVLYEIPAGKLDPDEAPLACAKRELSEETGYTAKNWQLLGSIVTTPGFSDEVIHIFLATGLELYQQHPDEDEFVEVESFVFAQIKNMIISGEIYDAKTLSAICYYQLLFNN